MKLRQTEAQFQRAVVDLAKVLHWKVHHTYFSIFKGRNDKGFPDWVFAKHGKPVIFAELKTEENDLTPAQLEWIYALEGKPDVIARRWRPSSWPEIERTLKA